MARNQGLNRLKSGVRRELHKSETGRAYIFITKDKALLDACKYKLDVTLNGKDLGIETIDDYGRIFPKQEWRKKLQSSNKIELLLDTDGNGININLS